MTDREMAKDILIALINKITLPSTQDEQHPSKWVAEAFKIVYQGIRSSYPPVD